MKKEIINILRCPTCGGPLIFNIMLNCENCGVNFPVVDDIAILLTPEDLQKFLKEPWGKELLKEEFGEFVSSNDTISKLQKIIKQAKLEGLKRYEAEDLNASLPEKLNLAIEKGRKILVEKIRVKRTHTILDWPTGPGFFLEYLTDIVPRDTLIIATDINFGQLATTKAYLDKIGNAENVLFVVCDARNMPFKDSAFQAVTAWGGTVEIPNSKLAVKESYRLLEKGGYFGISGDIYKEKSKSFYIAKKLNIESVATMECLKKILQETGFKNLFFDVIYEGHEADIETPPEERCPLPAQGDWYSFIIASGQKI